MPSYERENFLESKLNLLCYAFYFLLNQKYIICPPLGPAILFSYSPRELFYMLEEYNV